MEPTVNTAAMQQTPEVNKTQVVTAKPDTSTAALLSLLAQHLQSGLLSDAQAAQLGKNAASESKAHMQSDNKDEKGSEPTFNLMNRTAVESESSDEESSDTSSSTSTSKSSSSDANSSGTLTASESSEFEKDMNAVQAIATALSDWNNGSESDFLDAIKNALSSTGCSSVSALMDQLTTLADNTFNPLVINAVSSIKDNGLISVLEADGATDTLYTTLYATYEAEGVYEKSGDSGLTSFFNVFPGAEENKTTILQLLEAGGVTELSSDLTSSISGVWSEAETYFPGEQTSSDQKNWDMMTNMQALEAIVKDLSSGDISAIANALSSTSCTSVSELFTVTESLADSLGDSSIATTLETIASNPLIEIISDNDAAVAQSIIQIAQMIEEDPEISKDMGDMWAYTHYKSQIDTLNSAGGYKACAEEISSEFDSAWEQAQRYFPSQSTKSNSGSNPSTDPTTDPSTGSGSTTPTKQLKYGEMLSLGDLLMIISDLMNSEETNQAADASLATFLSKLESNVVSDMANRLNSFYENNIAKLTKASQINKETSQLNLYKSEWDNFQSQIDANVQNETNAAGTVDVNEVETTSDFESDILQTWANVANQIAEI